MRKCLEWYTELPYVNRPRISQTFLLQNIEFYFEFRRETNTYYYMYLKTKEVSAKLKSFLFTIHTLYYNTFKRNEVNFQCSKNYLTYFPESHFLNQAQKLGDGIFIRFIFLFDNSIGPLLPFETKIGKLPFYVAHF